MCEYLSNLDNAVIKNQLTDNVQPFHTMKPNDFKNATLDTVSFFPDVGFPAKSVSLVSAVSFNTSTLAPPYMQSNCDLFSENQAIDRLGPPRELSNS